MGEKKTKKMTKAEAFEWLKGKKVRCIGSGWNYCWDVLGKLQSFGLKWTGDWQKENYPIFSLFIDDSGRVTYLDIASAHTYNDYIDYVEVDLDDILSIEIVDEKKKSENVSIELEKWIGVIRDKFCCNHWSIVISASNFALFSGDLIEEKRIKE